MNKFKKLLTIAMASVMALGCFGTTVMAEENVWGVDVEAMPVYEDLNGAKPASVTYNPLWGQNRYGTAASVAQKAFAADKDKVNTAVLACGNDYPDALSANGLAGTLDCPLLLSHKDKLSPDTEKLFLDFFGNGTSTNIKTLYIPGGVLSDTVISRLKEIGVETINTMAGANRYETASMVANTILKIKGSVGEEDVCIVTSGKGSADALSASPISYACGMPILLTNGETLTDANKEILSHYNNVWILGGTSVINQNVEKEIKKIVNENGVKRLAGDNRYMTTESINDIYSKKPAALICVYNASNADFPDALASGMLSRLTDPKQGQFTVLMLTKPDNAVVQDYITNRIFAGTTRNVYLVGGQTNQSPLIDQIKAAVNAEHTS